MPRDFFARLLRWFALMVALTGLAACSNDYPSDWPPIVSPWFGACPDLSGSYDIAGGGPLKPPGVGAKLPFSSAWQTLTIVSRSGGLVDLTWLRPAGSSGLPTGLDPALRWSPANRDRSDEQFLAVLGVPPQALATSVSETRSSLRCSSGVMVLGHDEEVARDGAGDLVMMSGEQRVNPGQISLWCGDGCQGIPLGRSFRHAWRRWAPLKSPPAVAADRNDGRFEAPAWSAAANWRSDPQGDGPWRSALVPTLLQGVHLNELRMAGDHAAAVLSADSVDALTAALRAIDESRAFTAADVRRFSGRSVQPMTVGVLLERIDLLRSTRSAPAASMPPAVPSGPASADPMQGVRADVDAALPSGAVVEALSPAPRARGFVLRIRTTRDRAAGELMAALWKYHCDAVECLSICVPGYPPGVYEIDLRRQAALAS